MTLFTDSLYVSMTHERALELYCSRLNHQPRPAECASELARSHLQLTAAPQLPFGAATIERTQAVILVCEQQCDTNNYPTRRKTP